MNTITETQEIFRDVFSKPSDRNSRWSLAPRDSNTFFIQCSRYKVRIRCDMALLSCLTPTEIREQASMVIHGNHFYGSTCDQRSYTVDFPLYLPESEPLAPPSPRLGDIQHLNLCASLEEPCLQSPFEVVVQELQRLAELNDKWYESNLWRLQLNRRDFMHLRKVIIRVESGEVIKIVWEDRKSHKRITERVKLAPYETEGKTLSELKELADGLFKTWWRV